jgi:hypothetical protein
VLALGTALAATCPAPANINVEFRPETQTVNVGATVNIGLYVVSDDATDQLMSAAQILVTWQPTYLQFLGLDDTGGAPLMNYPPFPGHLPPNDANPPQDGNAMYIALAIGGQPVAATPAGTLLRTFQFEALALTSGTPVDIPASLVDPAGETIVFDGVIPAIPVTGTLTGATVVIVGGTPDCGDPGTGDCCEPNGTPFCDDAACCEAVCLIEPFCCTNEWDELCADLADDQPLCGCVDCGDPGTGDCCEPNGSPYCEDEACCELICGMDSYCCDTEWDDVCADMAREHCGLLCPNTGACCFPDGSCLDGLTENECEAMPGGDFQGVETECLGSDAKIIVWGVDDVDGSDSQLFVLNTATADLTLVGPEHDGTDIEAMAVFGDQVAGAAGTEDDPDELMDMDFNTGALTFIADIDLGCGDSEVTGMATDGNGVVWAFADDRGFGTLDLAGTFTVVVPSGLGIEGLAAALDGETLWGITDGGEIYEVDVSSGSVVQIDDVGSAFDDDHIENLELFSSNELAFFAEEDDDDSSADDDELVFAIYNIHTGELTTTELRDVDLEDIEAFIFASIDACPSVVTPACGSPLAGDCCEENSTASCLDAACCGIVCGLDPYCCDIRWDTLCADQAHVACSDLCVCVPPLVEAYAESAIAYAGYDGPTLGSGLQSTNGGNSGVGPLAPSSIDGPRSLRSSMAGGGGFTCTVRVSWEAFSASGCDLFCDAVVEVNGQSIPVVNGQIIEVDCQGPTSPGGITGASHPDPAAVLIVTVQDRAGNVATSVRQLCGICDPADGTGSFNGGSPSADTVGGNHKIDAGDGPPAAP